jgi:MoxR-like ATPase
MDHGFGAAIDLDEFRRRFEMLSSSVARRLLGKDEQVTLALVCLLADGHLLLEDVPGLGKTRLATALAESFTGEFRRVQGTPDLLPSDITGTLVLARRPNDGRTQHNGEQTDAFILRKGPIFANVVLCDEINRATPRTQSALLEAMEEHQVTIDRYPEPMCDPFLVIATQNPVESDGTYPLPEAQLDRFLMRLSLGYPEATDEVSILRTYRGVRRADERRDSHPAAGDDHRPTGLSAGDIVAMIRCAATVGVAPPVERYILDIVRATRVHPEVRLGASPRAALALQRAAMVMAAAEGHCDARLDDVKYLAPKVLAHRLVLRHVRAETAAGTAASSATAAQEDLIHRIVASTRVPGWVSSP